MIPGNWSLTHRDQRTLPAPTRQGLRLHKSNASAKSEAPASTARVVGDEKSQSKQRKNAPKQPAKGAAGLWHEDKKKNDCESNHDETPHTRRQLPSEIMIAEDNQRLARSYATQ
jgi:hypothetical protein